MGGPGKISDEDRTGGFDKNPQNINRKGRPPSIRNTLRELLQGDGKLVVPALNVIEKKEDGSVVIMVPDEKKIALKLKQLAMSGKGMVTLRAIQMIMEQLDGKPHQTTDVVIDPGLDLSLLDLDERKLYLSLVRKATPSAVDSE